MKQSKYFNTKNITKRKLRSLICDLAASLGVNRIRFNNKAKYVEGTYSYSTKSIYVCGSLKKPKILKAFFHELAHHVVSSNQRKWLTYHRNAATPLLSSKMKFNIENKVDKMAKKLWYKYVNIKEWGRYTYGYPKSQKKYIIEWIEDYYSR